MEISANDTEINVPYVYWNVPRFSLHSKSRDGLSNERSIIVAREY